MILFLADLHLHPWPEFSRMIVDPFSGRMINSRLLDQICVLRDAVVVAKHKGATTLVILGDVFHVKGVVDAACYQPVYDFFHWVKDQGLSIVILTGNHDQASADGRTHTVHGLGHWATIVDTPRLVTVGSSIVLGCVPYTKNRDTLKDHLHLVSTMVAKIKARRAVLCLHAGVDGAAVGPVEYRMKEPLQLEDLPDNFQWRLLGHYHKPQKLDKTTYYVGSPMQHNRGERGEAKRAMFLDKDMQLGSISLAGPEFHRIQHGDLHENLEPGYYDLVTPAGCINPEIPFVPGAAFKVVPTLKKSKKVRLDMEEVTTDEDLLKKYVIHTVKDKTLRKPLYLLGKKLLALTEEGNTTHKFVIKSVTVQNFLALHKAHLVLNQPGTIFAVLGENLDSEGFESNGSGKSSLLPESIYWGLYGKLARDIPAAKVVHNQHRRDCYVDLRLTIGADKVRVIRFRKCQALGGDGLILKVNNKDVSKTTVADTQAVLDTMLGIDFLTFSSVMAFSPDNLRFVGSTDATQKQVLDSILQVTRFGEAQTHAKSQLKDLKTSRQELREGVAREEGRLETHEETLAQHEASSREFVQQEKARRVAAKERVQDLKRQIIEAQEAHDSAKVETEALGKSLRRETKDLEKLDKNQLNERYRKALQHHATAKASVRSLKDEVGSLVFSLDTANESVGKPCPTCGQEMKHLGKLIASLTTQQSQKREALQQAEAALTTACEALKHAEDNQAIWEELSAKLKKAQDLLNKKWEHVKDLEQAVLQLQESLAAWQDTLRNPPANPYTELLEKSRATVEATKETLTTLHAAAAALDTKIQNLEYWVTAFGHGGIKNFLLEQVLPDLTMYANTYAQKLAGGDITIDFDLTQSASGAEKFSIKALNANGADQYGGNSSGERRRIDICVMLALFRVAAKRCRINLLVLDEVTDTLDTVGIESMLDLLRELAADMQLTIFITSHVGLSDYIEDRICIVKQNGSATLRG